MQALAGTEVACLKGNRAAGGLFVVLGAVRELAAQLLAEHQGGHRVEPEVGRGG